MRILLLGASGVAGRSTLPALLLAGHQVTAHTRDPAKARLLGEGGALPVVFDTDDRQALGEVLQGKDAVVDLRVAIPRPSHAFWPSAWRAYRFVRDQAVALLVEAMLERAVGRLVHDTVTLVYADGGDRWLDESSPVSAPGALRANLACEQHAARLTAAGGAGVVLRFSTFYGPQDSMSSALLAMARHGFSPLTGEEDGWQSWLHTSDVGPAVAAALDLPGGCYNVVDDEPLRRRDLRSVMAAAAGRSTLRHPPAWLIRAAPEQVRALGRSQRVSAASFKERTGWRPMVPSARQGWPAILPR